MEDEKIEKRINKNNTEKIVNEQNDVKLKENVDLNNYAIEEDGTVKKSSTTKKRDTRKKSDKEKASATNEKGSDIGIKKTSNTKNKVEENLVGTTENGTIKSKETTTRKKKVNSDKNVENNTTKKTARKEGESKTTENSVGVKSQGKKTSTQKSSGQKATTKVANVKKKITEEAVKTSSEKSSRIKLNQTEKKPEDVADEDDKVNEDEEYSKKIDINYIEEDIERKLDLNELDEEIRKRNSIPKQDFFNLLRKSSFSVMPVIIFIVFLIFNGVGFYNISDISFIKELNFLSFIFLGISIVLFEVSYKQESTQKCVIGIEALLMGIFSLILPYIYQIYHNTFMNLIMSSGVIILGYYIIKLCIVFYNNQNKYFRAQENLVSEDDDNEFNIEDDED